MITDIIMKLYGLLRILRADKKRWYLTLSGISIPLLLFLVFSEFTRSYSEKEMAGIMHYPEDAVTVTCSGMPDLSDALIRLKNDHISFRYTLLRETDDIMCKDISYRGVPVRINLHISKVKGSLAEGCCIPYSLSDTVLCFPVHILFEKRLQQGESDERDNGKIMECAIEKSTALLLFGKENAAGEYLTSAADRKNRIFHISYVIGDLPSAAENNLRLNHDVHFPFSKGQAAADRTVYLFGSQDGDDLIGQNNSISSCVFRFPGKDFIRGKKILLGASFDTGSCMITDQNDLIVQTREFLHIIYAAENLLLFMILIVSGLMIMNTIFFSIKERTDEIGIRRAAGAEKGHIVRQFLAEGLLLGMTAALISCIAAEILFRLLSLFFICLLSFDFSVSLHPKTILCVTLLSLSETLIFSLIPAIYASNIQPAEIFLNE